jgi:hypothetical protein
MLELNPLDVLNSRQLTTLPPHFSKTKIATGDRVDTKIVNWIRSKLSGRFCVVTYPHLTNDERFQTATFVGFEEQKELTYFMLACPHLRRN